MLRTYETIYVTNADLLQENVDTIDAKLKNFITGSGGEIGYEESWGIRNLSFSIKKQNKGKYAYLLYTAKPDIIKEIEFYLKISEPVLTFLTVKIFDKADLENASRPNVKDIV
jgi:small subunit ribosomal protein S6